MRTRLKARQEAEAAAAAEEQTLKPNSETISVKEKVLEKSPSPPASVEAQTETEDAAESSSESETEEESESVVGSEATGEEVVRNTKEQGSVNSGAPNLLLLEAEPSKVKPLPSVTGGFASSLEPQLSEGLYFSFDDVMMGGVSRTAGSHRHGSDPDKELMKKSVLPPDLEKKETAPLINQSRRFVQKIKHAQRKKSAGRQWFDMPATEITPELKNDLKLLRMRNALDPSQHYKANDSKELPRYFQVGRVVGGPTDFYSSRIPRRQQKQTLVDELLTNEEFRKYHKKKYSELQNKFSSGTKRYKDIKHKKKYKK